MASGGHLELFCFLFLFDRIFVARMVHPNLDQSVFGLWNRSHEQDGKAGKRPSGNARKKTSLFELGGVSQNFQMLGVLGIRTPATCPPLLLRRARPVVSLQCSHRIQVACLESHQRSQSKNKLPTVKTNGRTSTRCTSIPACNVGLLLSPKKSSRWRLVVTGSI